MAKTTKRSSSRKTVAKPQPVEEFSDMPPSAISPRQPSTLLIVLLIAVSFFSGYLFFKVQRLENKTGGTGQAQNQPPALPSRPTELKIKKPTTSEHWRGDTNARYAWVEYSDFECPFCKQIHPDMIKLLGGSKGKMAWVYRHFPLSFHPKAQKSAEATECAAELGGNDAFWKMADIIFEKMPDMELANLPALASQIGLDQTAFKTCLDSGKHQQRVKDDFDEGTKAGVQATPTSVIYDLKTGKTKLVEGALPYEQLKKELDDFTK